MIKDYFKIAWRSLAQRKMRSWLTMLGIFIGIAAVVSMVSLGQGLQKAINDQFDLLGTNKIIIGSKADQGFTPGSSSSLASAVLTDKDVETVDRVKGVESVAAFTFKIARVEVDDEVKFLYIVGIPSDPKQKRLVEEMNNFGIEEGRRLKQGDKYKVALGYNFKYKNVFKKALGIRDKILVEGQQFEVISVAGKIGNPEDDSSLWIPLETLNDLFGIEDQVSMIIAKVGEGSNMEELAENIKKAERKNRREEEGEETFYVQTAEQIQSSFNSVLTIVQVVVAGIAGISLFVGGIGIMNTMYTAVLQQTKEIGIMKAIGARNADILLLFLIESGLLGLAGGVVGILLGIGLSEIVAVGARQALGVEYFQAYFPRYLIVGAMLFAFLIGTLAGTLPARQASIMNPADSLRYE